MAEVRIYKPERQLTIRLVSAADETSSWGTMRSDLQSVGVKVSHVRQNPVTPGDVGKLIIDLVHNHGEAIGTAAFSLITMWVRQMKGRRIELKRGNLKITASSTRRIKETLAALHDYDTLTLALGKGKTPTTRKTTKRKKES